jgi:branched-chain amino acid transport system substrate-binding protein
LFNLNPRKITLRGFFFFGVVHLRQFLLACSLMCSIAHAEIVIGVAGPMTGTYAAFGQQMLHGAQVAVDDLNAKGGISGEILLLQPEDDGCDNRQAETVARDLIDKKANVVIGHFCSNAALNAARIYEGASIPMIASSASLPALTDAGLWNVIRVSSRDDAQGDFAAVRIASEYPTGVVAVLSDGSASDAELSKRFIANLGKAPALFLTFKPDAVDFDGLISQLKASKIDVIYFACNASDAGRIAAGLQIAGLKPVLFGSDALVDDIYWAKSGEAGEGSHASFSADPQFVHDAKETIAALKLAGFDSNGAALPSYAAVQLFAAAAEVTGVKNGKAISAYLRSGKIVSTAIGPLAFDAKGDVQPQHFVWYKWSGGTYAAESHSN